MKKIMVTLCLSLLYTQIHCSDQKSKAEQDKNNKTVIGTVKIYNKDGNKIVLTSKLIAFPNMLRIESWEDSEKQVTYYGLRPLLSADMGKKRKSFLADELNQKLLNEEMREKLFDMTEKCWEEAEDFKQATTLWQYYSDDSCEMLHCDIHEEVHQAKKRKIENVKEFIEDAQTESENEGASEMDESE